MIAVSDPSLIVGEYGIAIVVGYFFWRLIVWVRNSPPTPNPWDAEVDAKLEDPQTHQICPHCSTPQEPGAWFCDHCGSAVGPYNNLMPFVNCFSQGEVFRNGSFGRYRHRPLILAGFILISLTSFLILAPVYIFFVIRNWRGQADQ